LSFGNVSNKGLLPGSLEGRTGFAAGLGFVTSGVAGIGVEALFAQRGVKSDTPTDERKLDYVDVPVYLRLMVPTPGVRPFAYLGPQISFELRCKANDFDCPDGNRKKTTYAGVIGGGLRFGARRGFSVEGRYVYGLNDLKLGTLTDQNSYKTRSFMLMAGLTF
ncbi:MAG: porin family protein, partial [Gemmatimonadota bacterium]